MPSFTFPNPAKIAFALLLALAGYTAAPAQRVQQINEQQLQALLSDTSDTLHVVNFWATWCKPCIKELPYFKQVRDENRTRNLKVTLVSVDFPQDVETRLIPFLKRQPLPEPVLLLNAKNENEWLNLVDPAWSGAIPATVFYNKKRGVYLLTERELSLAELRNYVSQFLQTNP